MSIYLRMHPLLNPRVSVTREVDDVVRHGPTAVQDLSLPLEELWRQTRPTHRVDIKKLGQANFHVVMDEWSLLDGWASPAEFFREYRYRCD